MPINPKFDCTYYIGTSTRLVRLVAHPDGKGYVFNYTAEVGGEFNPGEHVFMRDEVAFDRELARLGLHKLDATIQAADFVFGLVNAGVKLFTGKSLDERKAEHGGVHSDTLMRHDTPKAIKDLFATE